MRKTFQHRIDDLRDLRVPERQYLGSTPFDGQPLEMVAALHDGAEELVTPARPGEANEFYGGIFYMVGPKPAVREYKGLIAAINAELGGNVGNQTPIAEMADAANIEAHLIRNPSTGAVHAFFLPSREYIGKLSQILQNKT